MKHRLTILLAAALACAAQTANLGHIDFPTSGTPGAQKHFIQGMLLLHSFEYEDARDEFQAASKIEPRFAMAYWGEALTHTHPLWMQQDVPAARAALARLAPSKEARLAAAPTEREKDYLSSVELLYGDGDKLTRDLAYAAALGRMHEKYPNDLDAASLYALALMGTCEDQRDAAVYMRAAAVAEEVFAKAPEHPGAIHYLIHAYDDPIHAPLGLRAARVYAKVAGSASHAQHMPSHIFIAMGMWADVVSANVLSVKVADDRIKAKGLTPAARNYHALLWLEYGYLQEGRVADAERVLADVAQSRGRGLNIMRAVYAVETGSWDKLGEINANGAMLPTVAALTAGGMLEVHKGQIDAARKSLALAQAKLAGGASAPQSAMAMPMPASSNDGKSAEIMIHELEALLLNADGKKDAALKMLADAAAAEDGMYFEFGPPMPVKPAHELYGELLLSAGNSREAKKQFQKTLERCPQRRLALQGLSQAERGLKRAGLPE